MPKLTPEEILKIQELKKKGYNYNQIANALGLTRQTVSKYCSMSQEEIDALIAKQEKAQAIRSHKPETIIRNIVNKKIIDKSAKDLVKVLRLGNFVVKNLSRIAENLGVDEEELIKMSVLFYLQNRKRIKRLERENKILKFFVKTLIMINDNRFKKQYKIRELRNLITTLFSQKIVPPKEIIDAYLKSINEVVS